MIFNIAILEEICSRSCGKEAGIYNIVIVEQGKEKMTGKRVTTRRTLFMFGRMTLGVGCWVFGDRARDQRRAGQRKATFKKYDKASTWY